MVEDLSSPQKFSTARVTLKFQGASVKETAVMAAIKCNDAPAVRVGCRVVKIDPRYFLPTEVETLLGDPSKAKQKLGWTPEITVQDMCVEMVKTDLSEAKRMALLKKHGYEVNISAE